MTSDNFGGMYALTQYLIRRGHRKIAYYPYSDAFLPTEAERFRGYCAALIDSGIAIVPEYFLAGSLSPVRSAGTSSPRTFSRQKERRTLYFMRRSGRPPSSRERRFRALPRRRRSRRAGFRCRVICR